MTKLLNGFIPGIQPESDIGSELTYKLPDSYSDRFEAMLSKLENNLPELRLNGFGVGITSLEDVFMKVGAESNVSTTGPRSSGGAQNENENQNQHQVKDTDQQSIQSNSAFVERHSKLRGLKLSFNQWNAMILKKMLLTWGNKEHMIIQIALPIIFVVSSFIFLRASSKFSALPPMKIQLTQYPTTVTVLDRVGLNDNMLLGFADQYKKFAMSYGSQYEFKSTNDKNFTEYILELGKTRQSTVNDRYMVAATITNQNMIAWFNNQPLHTAPLTVNMLHNAMARHLLGPNTKIEVTNYPLPYSPKTVLSTLSEGSNLGSQLTSNLCFSLCFVTTMYIFMLIKERVSRAKLLQFVSGVQICTFWLSQFLWDIFTFFVTVTIVILVIACFQEDGFSYPGELIRYFVILIIFGCSALPMTYLLSLVFTEAAFAFILVSMVNIFFGIAIFFVYCIMAIEQLGVLDEANKLAAICRVFPHFSLSLGLNNLYINYGTRKTCETLANIPPVLRCELLPTCCRK